MAQKLIQTQAQKLQQLQKLTAQQILQVKLLEMPLTELEESVNAELDDNPALESENPDDMLNESYDGDTPMDTIMTTATKRLPTRLNRKKKKEKMNWTRLWKA